MSTIKQMSIAFKDYNQMADVYMPFLRNGGIFIPTERPFELGDELFIALSLPDEPEKRIPVPAVVVWITPMNAINRSKPGIGVHFTGVQAQATNTRFKHDVAKATRRSPYTFTM